MNKEIEAEFDRLFDAALGCAEQGKVDEAKELLRKAQVLLEEWNDLFHMPAPVAH
jgi:hypothetical protein